MPRDATNTPASHTSALGELFIADEWGKVQAKVYEFGPGWPGPASTQNIRLRTKQPPSRTPSLFGKELPSRRHFRLRQHPPKSYNRGTPSLALGGHVCLKGLFFWLKIVCATKDLK